MGDNRRSKTSVLSSYGIAGNKEAMLKPTAPPILKHGLAVLWQCNQCHISMCVVYIVRHVACVVWVVGVCFSKYSDRWSVFAPNISTASGSYVALHCKEMICDAYAWWSNKGRDEREGGKRRSEEHTSELQSRPHISYAVFCLKKKKQKQKQIQSLQIKLTIDVDTRHRLQYKQ